MKKEKRLYILDEFNNGYETLAKARRDISFFVEQKKGKALFVGDNDVADASNTFKTIVETIKKTNNNKKALENNMKKIKSDSILLFQYPWLFCSYSYSKIIKKYAKEKNVKTAVIIHDIEQERTNNKVHKLYWKKYVNELKFLCNFDYIVVHNEKMKQWILSKCPNLAEERIIILSIFDYQLDSCPKPKKTKYKTVTIAGSLAASKAGFVYKLNELKPTSYCINLRGNKYTGGEHKNIKYFGPYKAIELTKLLDSGFGLVWDGDSLDKCDGVYGEYLKLNNPHKLSSYLACGIPVIVWSQSAEADFVKKEKVGLVVDSLEELNGIFKNMKTKDYEEFLKNVSRVQKRLTTGYYTNKVLDKLIK